MSDKDSKMNVIGKAFFEDLEALIKKHTEEFVKQFGEEDKGMQLGDVIEFNKMLFRASMGINLITTYATAQNTVEQTGVKKLEAIIMCRVVGSTVGDFMSGVLPHICGNNTAHEVSKYMLGKRARPDIDNLSDLIMEGAKPMSMNELMQKVKKGGIRH